MESDYLETPQEIINNRKSNLTIEVTQEFELKPTSKKNYQDLIKRMEKKQKETQAENREMHVKLEKLSQHINVLNNLIERLS